MLSTKLKRKILLIDDNESIHQDFKKILLQLSGKSHAEMNEMKSILFGSAAQESADVPEEYELVIDSAFQGKEAYELVKQAKLTGDEYQLAFVDIRMPPGWDGVETTKKLWEADPELQVVICSAHSDYSWEEINSELQNKENFLILKKPFDSIEIKQLVATLTKKWMLNQAVKLHISELEQKVRERTIDLEQSLSLTQATLESTQDGILSVSQEHKVVNFNNMFNTIWNLPKSISIGENVEPIFEMISDRVENSSSFLNELHELSKRATFIEAREWHLSDGKIIELYANPQLLNQDIIGTVYSFRDISERKKLEQALLHRSTHDVLTGLPNRLLLQDRIQQAIVQAKRYGFLFACMFVDVDFFKLVNDQHGHEVGDGLLKEITNRLLSVVRETDTISRIGGDEFVIITSSFANEEKCYPFVQKIMELFHEPVYINEIKIQVSCSVGVSLYPLHGTDSITLLKNADIALYKAKENGRNTWQIYLEEMMQKIQLKQHMEADLRAAIEHEQFVIYYQPLVDIERHDVIGVEALLRWNHPTLGLLTPTHFISIAEEKGLIVQIGDWVLHKVCERIKSWRKANVQSIKVAVNVSPQQLKCTDFVDKLKRILEENQVDPSCLELEITENILLTNFDHVGENMAALKALGVSIAIDDFGTGYSSLNYIRLFPINKIKIDKAFIDQIDTNKDKESIVKAMINMATSLKLEVVAEGIEEKAQINVLKKFDPSHLQGFYISRPLPEDELLEFLTKKEEIVP